MEKRPRKLLVKKRELSKLWQAIGRDGMTLVPQKLYFNSKGKVKVLLGIAKGKKHLTSVKLRKPEIGKNKRLDCLKKDTKNHVLISS